MAAKHSWRILVILIKAIQLIAAINAGIAAQHRKLYTCTYVHPTCTEGGGSC